MRFLHRSRSVFTKVSMSSSTCKGMKLSSKNALLNIFTQLASFPVASVEARSEPVAIVATSHPKGSAAC